MPDIDPIISDIWKEKEEDMLAAAQAMCAELGLPPCDSFEDIIWMLTTRSLWYLEEGRNLAKARNAIIALCPKDQRAKVPHIKRVNKPDRIVH